MAKKSSTIHVEEFVWDEIERIQKELSISSRNTAIEYLVSEYKTLKLNFPKVSNENYFTKKVNNEEIKKDIDLFNEQIDKLENSMPD